MILAPGSRLGPYEIVGPVGAGSMGRVYEARDPRLGRAVAIKVLPSGFTADVRWLRRFEQEARSAGGLSHPNILAIHDLGTHDGAPYVVSELLLGETLRARLDAGTLPIRQAVDYGVQIAKGLAAAHEKGIVHRDLKPENLFVTSDGCVKVLDFGLAKFTPAALGPDAATGTLLVAEREGTEPGTILGTAGYMSPEQAAGQRVDFRSDQFALGLILYELVTGKRAFKRPTSAETLSAIIREEPPPIGTLNPSVPPPYRWVVERCLAKDPQERYASTRDLAGDLAALRDHFAEASPSVAGLPAAPPAKRSHLLWAGGLLAAGFALGGGLALRLPRAPVPEVAAIRYLTYSGHDSAPAASPDGRTIAYTSDRDGTPRIWLKELSRGVEVALTSGPDDFARFSPDGSMILFARTEGARTAL